MNYNNKQTAFDLGTLAALVFVAVFAIAAITR